MTQSLASKSIWNPIATMQQFLHGVYVSFFDLNSCMLEANLNSNKYDTTLSKMES